MSFSFLQSTIFASSDLDTYLMPVTEENPIEQLLINLFPENEEENYFLHLAYINDILKDSKVELKEYEDSYILQFYVVLPFTILDKEQEKEMSYLLTKINAQLPQGSFGLNESQLVHYRYYLVSEEREVEPQLIIQLTKQIKQIIEKSLEPLDLVINKQKSSEEVIKNYFNDNVTNLNKSIFEPKYLRSILNQTKKLNSSYNHVSEYSIVTILTVLTGGAIAYLTEPLWGLSSLLILLLTGFSIQKKRSQKHHLLQVLSDSYQQIYAKSEIYQNNQMKLNGQLDRLQTLKKNVEDKLTLTMVENTEDLAERWKQKHTLQEILNQIENKCMALLSKRHKLEQEKKLLKTQQETVFKKMEEIDSALAVQQAIKMIRIPHSFPSYKSESGLLSIQVLLNHLEYSLVTLPIGNLNLQHLMLYFKEEPFDYWLAINFQEPLPEEGINGVYLIFSTFLPVEISSQNKKDFSHFLIWLNRILSIGSFGIHQDKYVYFKYSLFLADYHTEATSVVESLELINFFVTKLGKQVLDANQNQNDLDLIAKNTEDAFTKASKFLQGSEDIEDDSLGLMNEIKNHTHLTYVDNPEQIDYAHLTQLVEELYRERHLDKKSPGFNRLKTLLLRNQEKANYSYSEIYAKLKHYEAGN